MSQATPPVEIQKEFDSFQSVFGKVPRSYREVLGPYADHLPLFEGHAAMERALAAADQVEPALKILVTIKVALILGCRVCAEGGATVGDAIGIGDAKLAALAGYESTDVFSPRERLALDYATAVSAHPGVVPDALRAKLEKEFSRAELVELAAWIAMEHYRVRFRRAMLRESEEHASEADICLVPAPNAAAAR